MTVSVILGVILYIGYTIIGLPYTLLVLFVGVANLIPFLDHGYHLHLTCSVS